MNVVALSMDCVVMATDNSKMFGQFEVDFVLSNGSLVIPVEKKEEEFNNYDLHVLT